MISHPYPLGTLGTHHEPTSPRNAPSRSQSTRSIARRLSYRSAAGRTEEEAEREGFRRLFSPSPEPSSSESTEVEIKPPKSSSILTGRDGHHGAKRLRKVIRVEGDWDLIRGVDTDGYDNSGNRT
ncbi:hypothetical protein L486_00933 [Kwoniella mangroviensis CBS 10435]|uniref:Uncharacterized protein n=1 Tax=Kwoniella mangroviensis CBS 10435 TaxID=1331196 RepID=A0A1B9J0I0_9TREE|nr:hypothetical protein L486_00933 [Kwoniella mangroviensis CBS 10435]